MPIKSEGKCPEPVLLPPAPITTNPPLTYTCGNTTCETEKGENYNNCPNDCLTSGTGAGTDSLLTPIDGTIMKILRDSNPLNRLVRNIGSTIKSFLLFTAKAITSF